MKCLSFIKREIPSLLILLVVATVVFCGAYGKWSSSDWKRPLSYEEDAPQVLTWIKAASEGDYYPFAPVHVSRLGAPGEANWNDYPMYEKGMTLGMGWLACLFGLIPAANLGTLFAHVSAVLSFFLVCRYLRYGRDVSMVMALLYGFAFYIFWRDLRHLLLTFIFTVPPALLVSWIVGGSRTLKLSGRKTWGCMVVAVVLGLGSPFNLNLFLHFVFAAGLYAWLAKGQRENLNVALACIVVAGGAFVATNAGTFIYQFQHGSNPIALEREYLHAEIFARKPMELFLPSPEHRVGFLSAMGERYDSENKVVGENFSPYLGIVGSLGLAWMLVEVVGWMMGRVRRTTAIIPLLQAHWVLAFCLVGGLNSLIAFGGFRLFRASNRFSIFILAIVLLFLAGRLSSLMAKWGPGRRRGLLLFILVVGLLDQIPVRPDAEATGKVEERVQSDMEYAAAMEKELGQGSMVFQMPVVGFPEGRNVLKMEKYEHSRPYLFSESLRFSYGSNKGRQEDSWQLLASWQPVGILVRRLQNSGFAGLHLNRKGFVDEGRGMMEALSQLGLQPEVEGGLGEMVCYTLTPSGEQAYPCPVFVREESGWLFKEHGMERTINWAAGRAVLRLRNDDLAPRTVILRCGFLTLVDGNMAILLGSQAVDAFAIKGGRGIDFQRALLLAPGEHELIFQTDTGAFPHPEHRDFRVALGVVNLSLE